MNVEKSENFRLGESDGMQDGAGFEPAIFAEFDDHLHAERPFAGLMALRAFRIALIDVAADRSHRTVAHHRQRGVQVHARRETRVGMALKVGALIGEPHASNRVSFNQRFGDRHARPDLHQAGGGDLIADPLVELAKRQHEAIVLSHEGRSIGQFEGIVLHSEDETERAQYVVG